LSLHLPPVVGLALAYATGVGLILFGAFSPPALLALLLTAPLILLWPRPAFGVAVAWTLALLAGGVAASSVLQADAADCRLALPDGWEGWVEGRTLSRIEVGRTVPFRPQSGLPGGCREVVRILVTGGMEAPPAGAALRLRVRWEGRGHPPEGRAEWAGRLRVLDVPQVAEGGDLAGRLLAIRGGLQERMSALWGQRAPTVEALVLARREHLDPGLREAFALSGTAHLLAISGFHVGVVAGLLLGALRLVGLRRRPAALGAALGCWGYVLGIGAPHAAVRAALILTLLAGARIRGRPVVPVGALASALLLLLVADPRNLRSIGFQLSFAGTAGLVLLRGPLGRWVDQGWRHWRGRPLVRGRKVRGPAEGILKGGADGLVAGTAATLPTLPLLAWHFDRISVVGIPATLAVAPVVAAAIPGVGATLLLSLLPGPLAPFLAGGVGLLLAVVEALVRWCAELPGASIWVSRRALYWGGGVALTSSLIFRLGFPGRVRGAVRRSCSGALAVAVLLLLPLIPGPAALEVHMVDVGQGDAVALRLPSDRWMVVDAGPRSDRFDAGHRRVVPYLRRHGVRRLEVLVLSHPHLDHVGGAPAVLRELPVRGVLDPSRPVPGAAWRETLAEARVRGASWWTAVAGLEMALDGVELTVLHPDVDTAADPELSDWNDLSIVLMVRYGEATVLLTGDAYHWVEEAALAAVPQGVTVLKVGHHGSRTSTGEALLARAEPRVALVGVGDGNRYGHPHPEVIRRLDRHGVSTYRTDRDGDLRVRIHRDGSVQVRTGR